MNLSCQFRNLRATVSLSTQDSPALLERHPPLARLGGPGPELARGLAVGANDLLLRVQAVDEAEGELRPRVREVRPQNVCCQLSVTST